MNRLPKILIVVFVIALCCCSWALAKDRHYKLLALPHKGPIAVLTINFAPDPPKGFAPGEFYVLKALKVRGTKVDFGFCRLEVEE